MKEFIYEEEKYIKRDEYKYFEDLLTEYDFMPEEIQDEKDFNIVMQYFLALTEKAPDFIPAYEYAIRMIDCLEPDKELSELQKDMEIRWFKACQRVAEKEDIYAKQVPWGWMENRPLIRGLYSGADKMWQEGKLNQAHELFSKILKTNEGDNVGARYAMKATKEKMNYEEFEKRFTYEEDGMVLYNGELEKWFGG
ncbi:hypothetical protein JYT74_02985 [Crocinitomix catalasitica]|nr:hypothetical protein [Crocinitomix catalasitica]